jgi:hypothetical protein
MGSGDTKLSPVVNLGLLQLEVGLMHIEGPNHHIMFYGFLMFGGHLCLCC